MICPACAYPNTAAARFCSSCGSALGLTHEATTAFSATAPTPAAPAGAPAPTTAWSPGTSAAGGTYSTQGGSTNVNVVTNVHVAAPSPTVVVFNGPQGPGLLVRALYFLFIGLWLGAFCTMLAWCLNVTIIGLPLGLLIINRLPQIMTLQPTPSNLQVTVQNGVVVVQHAGVPQASFLVRALYFLVVGWWLSGLWLLLAWGLVGFTLGLGLPLAFWMFNRVPAITTLAR